MKDNVVSASLVIAGVNDISEEDRKKIVLWLRNNLIQFECADRSIVYTDNMFSHSATVVNGAFQ